MTCEDIDDIVYELCLKNNCYPSPLRYSNFPKCVTTSVNNVAVHGIPDSRPLLEGDIISIDVSVFVGTDSNGHHGDCCHTFAVGECDPAAKHLVSCSGGASSRCLSTNAFASSITSFSVDVCG